VAWQAEHENERGLMARERAAAAAERAAWAEERAEWEARRGAWGALRASVEETLGAARTEAAARMVDLKEELARLDGLAEEATVAARVAVRRAGESLQRHAEVSLQRHVAARVSHDSEVDKVRATLEDEVARARSAHKEEVERVHGERAAERAALEEMLARARREAETLAGEMEALRLNADKMEEATAGKLEDEVARARSAHKEEGRESLEALRQEKRPATATSLASAAPPSAVDSRQHQAGFAARIEGEVRGLRAEHTGAVRTLEGEMRCAQRRAPILCLQTQWARCGRTPRVSSVPNPLAVLCVRHLSADIEDVARELRARRALESAQVPHCPLPALLIKRF
jgi:hypothetical protein